MALVACPACSLQVSDQAVACPGCGHPLGPPPLRGWRAWRPAILGASIAVVVLAAAARLLAQNPAPPVPTSATTDPERDRVGALEECQRLIRLDAGPTRPVTFVPGAATVEPVGSGSEPTFAVRGSFDISSTRGEPLRTTYTCTVRRVEADRWQFVSLQMP